MRLLLDSHTILWYFHDPDRLSGRAGAALDSSENQAYISAVSFWEIAIEAGLGKLRLSQPLSEIRAEFVAQGAKVIDITADHAIAVEHLALHHRDPFDRLLAVQALAESLTLVSKDEIFDRYGVHPTLVTSPGEVGCGKARNPVLVSAPGGSTWSATPAHIASPCRLEPHAPLCSLPGAGMLDVDGAASVSHPRSDMTRILVVKPSSRGTSSTPPPPSTCFPGSSRGRASPGSSTRAMSTSSAGSRASTRCSPSRGAGSGARPRCAESRRSSGGSVASGTD